MCENIYDSLDVIYDTLNELHESISDIVLIRSNVNMLLNGVTDKNLVISKELDDHQEERIRKLERDFKALQISLNTSRKRESMRDAAQVNLFKELMSKINK